VADRWKFVGQPAHPEVRDRYLDRSVAAHLMSRAAPGSSTVRPALPRPDHGVRSCSRRRMRDQEARRLRREFAARERGRGKPYPAALRERATRWARRQAVGGASIREIATTLGVHGESVRRWLQSRTAPAALVPVEVVAGP